jgi:hypothetical protein
MIFSTTPKEYTMGKTFAFQLNEPVVIKASRESGEVIGRADYVASENAYLIRYKAADGRATDQWWGESALDQVAATATA